MSASPTPISRLAASKKWSLLQSLATQANPRFTPPLILHAAAVGSLGRGEDAKTVVQRLLELQPGITVATAILSARYVDPKNIAALANALRQAGLPDG